jgi:hypothetical protein
VPPLIRRGASQLELLIALTLTGILAASLGRVMRRIQDAYRGQTLTVDRTQTLRVASTLFPAELRELDATDGDIVSMSATAITIRAPRQLAFLCRDAWTAGPGALTLTLRDAPRYGLRDLDPRTDSLWVLRRDDIAIAGDDWVLGAVSAVSSDTCPGGAPGQAVTVVSSGATVLPGAGAPVLGFESLTYRLYRSSGDGQWYVGQQAGADLQPVLGPVTRDGLAFTYQDSTGAITGQPDRVSLIEVRVRASASGLAAPVDSVVLAVALRNNRRF